MFLIHDGDSTFKSSIAKRIAFAQSNEMISSIFYKPYTQTQEQQNETSELTNEATKLP